MPQTPALSMAFLILIGAHVPALAQFTVENPVILSPAPSLTGPRYAAPDRMDRDRRFDPNAPPQKGVADYADRRFLQRNVPPFIEWDRKRSRPTGRPLPHAPRPSVPRFGNR